MTSYAIVQTGGKQYRVAQGDKVRVESLPADVGDRVDLTDVLLVSHDGDLTVGRPTVAGGRVVAEVLSHGRADKVVIFKYKSKTRYRRKNGHRQSYTDLRIVEIAH